MAAQRIVTEVEICGEARPIGVQSTDYVITNIDNPDTGEKYTLTEYLEANPGGGSPGSVCPDLDCTLVNWMKGKYDSEIGALFTLTQTNTNSIYADLSTSISAQTVVLPKFQGVLTGQVDNHETLISNGWVYDANAKSYTKSLPNAVDGNTIAATEFKYTPSSGTYAGNLIKKNSSAVTVNTVYPIYIGFISTENPNLSNLEDSILSYVRKTSAISGSNTQTNNTGSAGYFYVLTKSTTTPVASVMNLPVTFTKKNSQGVSFTPPAVGNTTYLQLTGYNLYIAAGSIAAGTTVDYVLTVKIS